MLTDDKIAALWGKLSNEFNVHVRSIGTGMTKDGNECTVVTVDDKTPRDTVAGLPPKYANEQVEYFLGGEVVPYKGDAVNPPCGAAGHQCGCDTQTPKP